MIAIRKQQTYADVFREGEALGIDDFIMERTNYSPGDFESEADKIAMIEKDTKLQSRLVFCEFVLQLLQTHLGNQNSDESDNQMCFISTH